MKVLRKRTITQSPFSKVVYAIGSIFDISGTYFTRTKFKVNTNCSQACDNNEIAGDWKRVGNDIKISYHLYLNEIKDPHVHERIKRKLESTECANN